MKPAFTNSRARKAGILIPILVVIPLMGLGFYIVLNLLDTTPPTLMVSGLDPNQGYRGSLTLNIIAVDKRSGLGLLTVQVDDAVPTALSFLEEEPTLWKLQTDAFADGLHTVSVTAMDRSLHKNQAQYTLPFYIDNTPPTLQLHPETLSAGQGKTLALFVQADELLS